MPTDPKDRGRHRARVAYRALGTCEVCGTKPAVERHHQNGDTLDNDRANLVFTCRRCHMVLDGRLSALALARRNGKNTPQAPKPCATCQRPAKPLRRGLCEACYSRLVRRA